MAATYTSQWVGRGRVQRASPHARQKAELEELFRLHDEDASELLLVRNAEPACGVSSFGSVDRDRPLSETGIDQARRLAERLGSLWVEAIYAAPELRTRWTAQIIADALGRPLTVLDDLRDVESEPAEEVYAACFQPSFATLFQQQPRWDALPGFEASRAFRQRIVQTIEGVLANHEARRVVVVSHSSVINAYVSMLLDVPRDLFFLPDHASVSTVRALRDLYAVRSLNDTSHLVEARSRVRVLSH